MGVDVFRKTVYARNSKKERSVVERRLEKEALSGDIESAKELAFFERFNSITTNLDACPAAAEAYEKARASLLEDMDNDSADL